MLSRWPGGTYLDQSVAGDPQYILPFKLAKTEFSYLFELDPGGTRCVDRRVSLGSNIVNFNSLIVATAYVGYVEWLEQVTLPAWVTGIIWQGDVRHNAFLYIFKISTRMQARDSNFEHGLQRAIYVRVQ